MSGLRVCPQCKIRIERCGTDGNGRLVVERVPCHCRRPKRRWAVRVDDARRRACICQHCERPVAGKPKVALYCAEHRAEAHTASRLRYRERTGNENGRAYYRRHRRKILRKARTYTRRNRDRLCAYKRRWRQANRDKVRAQKRREALRRGGDTPAAIKRWRTEVAAGIRAPGREPRNANGERVCLHDCGSVVVGRAKLCASCRSAGAP